MASHVQAAENGTWSMICAHEVFPKVVIGILEASGHESLKAKLWHLCSPGWSPAALATICMTLGMLLVFSGPFCPNNKLGHCSPFFLDLETGAK